LKDKQRVNKDIRARSVRVISGSGDQLGIMDLSKALEIAENEGLDLVEVSPSATPPVCKVMNHGKYLYEQKKKKKEAQKNQVKIVVKEIKLRPNTDTHDLEVKARKATGFLAKDNKVKLYVQFKGREYAHPELGRDVLNKFKELVGSAAIVDSDISMEGRRLTMTLSKNHDK
jgi:translation initiation factor IF-3